MLINNIPTVKPAIIAVSRDNFPSSLSEKRRIEVVNACKEKNIDRANLVKGNTTEANEKFIADEIIKEIVSFINDFYKRDDDDAKN